MYNEAIYFKMVSMDVSGALLLVRNRSDCMVFFLIHLPHDQGHGKPMYKVFGYMRLTRVVVVVIVC